MYISVTVSPTASSTTVWPEPRVAAGVIVMLLPAVVHITVLICPVLPAAKDKPVAPPEELTVENAVFTDNAVSVEAKASVELVAIKVGM